MFYALLKAVAGFAIRLFYRVKVRSLPADLDGPVMFVCNHPNSIIDPALLFAVLPRRITFLAKAPLFEVPVFGWLLKGIGALPVFRKQDHPGLVTGVGDKNEGTFEAACGALRTAGAITLFPEGKSHSEPRLAEIKTGAARIALRAVKGVGGASVPVRIVAVGLTYQQKHRFRSEVLVEATEPIDTARYVTAGASPAQEDPERVRALTEAIEAGLAKVTLNLENWEDLPLIQTAEELYSLRIGEKARDPDRMRRFGRGVELFRREQPEKFEQLRDEVMTYRTRLGLVHARPKDLRLTYNRLQVWKFAFRNLGALLLAFPLFGMGLLLFAIPFYIPRWAVKVLHQPIDRQGTIKFFTALILTPLVFAALGFASWKLGGPPAVVISLLGAVPLALFTRYFFERRRVAWRDMQVFFTLGNRKRLKAMLLAEGERLAAEIEQTAVVLKPRVMEPLPRQKAETGTGG